MSFDLPKQEEDEDQQERSDSRLTGGTNLGGRPPAKSKKGPMNRSVDTENAEAVNIAKKGVKSGEHACRASVGYGAVDASIPNEWVYEQLF